jgi:hypothetical protein
MTTSRVEKLARMGISFAPASDEAASEAERKRCVRQCGEIYRAAFARVGSFAEYVDQVNAVQAAPFERFELSETFQARDHSLTEEIDMEVLSDAPDLDRFKKLVAEWEANCMDELKAKVTGMGRIPD